MLCTKDYNSFMDSEVGKRAWGRASCGKLQGTESEWGKMSSGFSLPLPDKEALIVALEKDSAPGLRQRDLGMKAPGLGMQICVRAFADRGMGVLEYTSSRY